MPAELSGADDGRPVAVIVDGYSTANFLPDAFARLGVALVHVQSSVELLPLLLPPDLTRCRENLVCPDEVSIEATVSRLKRLAPIAVLVGGEPGVPLADALSERMGLPTNGSALSSARRHKYRMIETLRLAGIRCARQLRTADPDEAVAWAGSDYPVVVKPLSSSSTDNVFICPTPDRVRAAATTILAARDMFGTANTEVLVQSYLAGIEYIVDTVSVDGRRHVCGVWEYEKTTTADGQRVYDKDVLLAADDPVVPALVAYIDTVLVALNIRYGPAHAEVIMTPDGPALVELGARLNGNMNPDFHDTCLGANQAGLTALAYCRPAEFLARYADRVYTRRQPAVVHNTVTDQDGVVAAVDQTVVDEISALPTVALVVVRLAPGKRIRPTVDLMSSPLRVFLTGTDESQLAADHRAIQALKDRVYRLQ